MSTEHIYYDLRARDQPRLPNTLSQAYNASVYGQLVTNLVDNTVIPSVHLLDMKAVALDKEVWSLCMY